MSQRAGLPQKIIGPGALFVIALAASSPMTVVGGGIRLTYATTGVVGVALAFLLLTGVLALNLHSYAAASQHIKHSAAAYALSAIGLGPVAGVGVGFVAVAGYNAIQISLYGLIGYVASGQWGGPWWLYALVVWLAIAIGGVFRPVLGTWVSALLVLMQIVILLSIAYIGLAHAPDGITMAGLSPTSLFVDGVGGVLALSVAAFVGFDVPATFSEEARGAVRRATLAAVIVGGLLYAATALSMVTATGPDSVAAAASSETFPFELLGPLAPYTVYVFILAMVTAALVFHNTASRFHFALGRERVFPYRLSKVNGHKVPVAGSIAQSVLSLGVIILFIWLDLDPITGLFTPFSTFAAECILLVLVVCTVAAARYFHLGYGGNEGVWTSLYIPLAGTVLGTGVLVTMMWNVEALLGVAPGATSTRVLPGLLILVASLGMIWGAMLRSMPKRRQLLGRGRPDPLRDPDASLSDIEI